MRLIRRISFLLFVTCMTLMSSDLLAQVTAAFSASANSGCPPLVVSFTNQSTATGGITLSYEWDDGTNFSTLTNPVLGYTTPGTYTITLTATDVNNSSTFDTETLTITVHSKPNVQFNFTPSTGCAPLAVSFTSANSTAGSGTILSKAWDFGDGNTGSGNSPSHNYGSSGNYTPSLTITNSFGCQKTKSSTGSVVVSGGPNASFTSGTHQACAPPLTVNFNNTTSGGQTPYSYNWDLDVGTSTAASPSQTYSSTGTYDIQLIVTDAAGCVDTLNSPGYVVITSVVADFDVESPACKGEPITLTNNTVGASQFTWKWGDNSTGNGANPSKSYASGGTYTITLTGVSGTCSDSHTETVEVQEITPSFTVTPDYFCEPPYLSYYTNTSTVNFGTMNYKQWRWGVFDFINANLTIWSEISTNGHDTIIRDYDDIGYFDDTLIIATAEGCTAQVEVPNSVLIEKQDAFMNINPMDGCVPILVDFTDASTPTTTYQINSWFWDFGNGTTSNLQNPSNILFTDTGCYIPKLVIQNTYGCKDSVESSINQICYGTAPSPMAYYEVDSICASDSLDFLDITLDSFANEFYWNFSDGSHYVGDSVRVGFADTGWIDLEYVVGHYGCYDTINYDSVAYIMGPLISIDFTLDCSTPFERGFFAGLKGVDRFYWDFVDGSPLDSINDSLSHIFPQTGTYVVELSSYNDTYECEMTKSVSIEIYDVQALFDISNYGSLPVDSFSCHPGEFKFDALPSIDNLPEYTWYTQNDTFFDILTYYEAEFLQTGENYIILEVHDPNYCPDRDTQYVFVSKPIADFEYDYVGGCDPVNIQFNDLSTADTSIVRWSWNYGDGQTDSNALNPIHTYLTAGNYPVSTTITDAIGCKHVTSEIIEIRFPYVGFLMDSIACENSIVSTLNQSIGDSLTYFWHFDNGSTSTQKHPNSQLYVSTGLKTVWLAIEDKLGCKDTAFHTLDVKPKPIVNFVADSTQSPCLPLFVTFRDSSIAEEVASYKWNFGDGTSSALLLDTLAFHTYTTPGKFDVSLTVSTIYGCKGKATKSGFIQVSGPYAEFDLAPDSVCINEPVKFFVTERSRMASYTWVYGDGYDTTVVGSVDTVWHAYDRIGTRTPIVVYHDSLNICQIPYFDSVYIHEVKSIFGFSPDSLGCGVLNAKMLKQAVGANYWRWNIEDKVSEKSDPLHYFNQPGEYDVQLYVENLEIGCIDSMTKKFVVYPKPRVKASADTLICLGDSTEVFASSDMSFVTWKWSPTRYATTDSLSTTIVAPDETVYMVATATDTNFCQGMDSVRVTVQDTPAVELFRDTTVVIGEVVIIDPKTEDELTYEWLPAGLLSCSTCEYPTFLAAGSQEFTLVARDIYGCFEKEFPFSVFIDEKYSLDVPDAFSPNGDGVNDVIYARGWGVKELLEFRIYNRWGQEVFSSNSMHTGWDGTYRGKEQSMDTYAYIVKALRYNGEEEMLEGFIELVR